MPSIRERGLLSTTAILDLYGIVGQDRENIEERRRPKNVTVQAKNLPDAVIRDQIPMSDKALQKCLLDDLEHVSTELNRGDSQESVDARV